MLGSETPGPLDVEVVFKNYYLGYRPPASHRRLEPDFACGLDGLFRHAVAERFERHDVLYRPVRHEHRQQTHPAGKVGPAGLFRETGFGLSKNSGARVYFRGDK